MKHRILALLVMIMLGISNITANAVGSGNVDGGGGGMGSGSSTNMWIPGEEGVRVSVIRVTDNAQVSSSFDMVNFTLRSHINNFGIYSKLAYRDGLALTPQAGGYTAVRPTLAMPTIIPSNSRPQSIEAIKSYFCSEYAVQLVANQTGIEYATLINGNYKILIEPVAYFLFNGNYFAMSAHQAAMYDQILSGGLRARMVSLSHKNLPLAMFLEKPDLGYAAWNGNRSQAVSNDIIINYLGLGIVKFNEEDIIETDPELLPDETVYEYRTDTDVITSVMVNAEREYNPDNPLTARFDICGHTYIVENIVIPDGESQLVWVKWHTPPTPQNVVVTATVGGRTQTINARVNELTDNEPPDPKANDRNDEFELPEPPSDASVNNMTWGVWSAEWHEYWVWVSNWEWVGDAWVDNGQWVDEGWYDFTYNIYEASLTVNQTISPSSRVPTKLTTKMKSGYGYGTDAEARVVSDAPQSAYTQAQNAVMYFPEFDYETYFRVLDRNITGYMSTFKFKKNKYSTYQSRVHFTPIWYPDSEYKSYTEIIDAWTPVGMLKVNKVSSVLIQDNLFSDWHIAPKNY